MHEPTGETASDSDLSSAAATARALLARLADDLAARDGADAQDAATALREAEPVLDRLAAAGTGPADAAISGAGGPALILDVSDLLGYFAHNRLPTGIQRVQAELVYNILTAPGERQGQLCCFVEGRDVWVAVPATRFLDLCAQSRTGGDPQEPRWRKSVDTLRADLDASPALAFPQGGVLANVGSSWWLPEYFFHVRAAKAAYGLRYVPVIHDLIPIITPQYCAPELVEEFVRWFTGMLNHADFFFTVSESTKRDLIAYAAKVGHTIADERVRVLPLNADFRQPGLREESLKTPRRLDEPYVLFVSTLEARKNQLGAMDAWTMLMAKHGAARVPKLVLVGKRGFQSDIVLGRLEQNAALRERVVVMSSVSDAELQTLYRDCLFTIYPSVYEGWGLPVTESLCHGKVPVIADNTSLPQAGDRFAVYFETGSTAAFVAVLERMIFAPGVRQQHEQVIRDGFVPRTWGDIARQLMDGIAAFRTQASAPAARHAIADPGFYYPLKRSHSMRVWQGSGSGEIYRRGSGWFKIEDHGCWIKPAGAELAMHVPGMTRGRIAIELFAAPRSDIRYVIAAVGTDARVTGRVGEGPPKWVFLDLPPLPTGGDLVISITATVIDQPDIGWNGDFRPLTIGIGGFFLFDDAAKPSRLDFVEAVALGALGDYNRYRDRSMDTLPANDEGTAGSGQPTA